MKKRVLIIGAGVAGRRYVDALMFDEGIEVTICGFGIRGKSKDVAINNSLCYLEYDELTDDGVRGYDLIIFCVPLKAKFRIMKHILEDFAYDGRIIIEKPLTVKVEEFQKYKRLLQNREFIIGYARRYLTTYERFPDENEYDISIASFTCDFHYNVTHMLPHLLEWMIRTDHSFGFVERRDNEIVCLIDDKKSIICFDAEIKGIIIINGVEYKNPIFMENLFIVRSFLKGDISGSSSELENEAKIVDIIYDINGG